MKKYTITVEKIETYEIIAEDEEVACDKAEEMFDKAEATYYVENKDEIED
jgi:hypothetical protein